MENSTIVAIATPVAAGGVGVIRISGPRSREILAHVFRRRPGPRQEEEKTAPEVFSAESMESHRFYHGYIVHNDQPVDEVLVAFMRAPRSYTGEDVVEIHAHSGPFVLRTILQLLLDAGAEMAAPGDFTRRAFMNGKMDLTRAEAVADIIDARSVGALTAAANQVAGKLSEEIGCIKEKISGLLVEMEAAVDFPEQMETASFSDNALGVLRSEVVEKIQSLIDRHDDFSWIRTGVTVALVGLPNVGKSTLLNVILGRDRAIVSPVPGTTRDFIEETVMLEGVPFVFTDTAGLRSLSGDDMERAGIKRTREVLSRAETIIYMVDASAGVSAEDYKVMATIHNSDMIIVANKNDLPEAEKFVFPPEWIKMFPALKISALTGDGVSELRSLLTARYRERLTMDAGGLIPSLRHKAALEKAFTSVLSAIAAFENGLSEEMIVIDLREAIDHLNEITGDRAGTDLLDRIFGRFCLGK